MSRYLVVRKTDGFITNIVIADTAEDLGECYLVEAVDAFAPVGIGWAIQDGLPVEPIEHDTGAGTDPVNDRVIQPDDFSALEARVTALDGGA